jgi:predicted nucleic acid-binding protein
MKYLVDANVLSEGTRPIPDPSVIRWLEENEPELAIDSIVFSELAVGVESLPRGRKRARLEAWFEGFQETIECLPWDAATGREWARLVVELRRRGRKMPLFDSMIAATARAHGLTIVTRNVRDFEPTGVEVLNPFSIDGSPDAVHEPGGDFGS